MAAGRPCGRQLHGLHLKCHQQHAVRRGRGRKEGAASPRPKPTIRPGVGTVLIRPRLPHAKQSGQHTLQPAAKQSRMLGSMDAMLATGLPMPVMIKLTRASISGHGRAVPARLVPGSSNPNTRRLRQADANAITVSHPLYCPSQHENVSSVPAQHTVVSGAAIAGDVVLKTAAAPTTACARPNKRLRTEPPLFQPDHAELYQ